jgi:hypothetical protein
MKLDLTGKQTDYLEDVLKYIIDTDSEDGADDFMKNSVKMAKQILKKMSVDIEDE